MSDMHLHPHFPPGTEIKFDGQTLTAKPSPGQEVTSSPDKGIDFEWPVLFNTETPAAKGGADSS